MEGKSDYYILNWFKAGYRNAAKMEIVPVNGIANAGALLSLYLGWVKDFVFHCDSDAEGENAKVRYIERLPVRPEHFIDYSDVFGEAAKAPRMIEDLISKETKSGIADYYSVKRCSKSHILRYFSSALMGGESSAVDQTTVDNLARLFDAIEKRMIEETATSLTD